MPRYTDWGGVLVDFSGCTDSMESIFGTDDISPGILSRRLWAYITAKGIKRPTRARKALGGIAPPPRSPVIPTDSLDDVQTYKRRRRA